LLAGDTGRSFLGAVLSVHDTLTSPLIVPHDHLADR